MSTLALALFLAAVGRECAVGPNATVDQVIVVFKCGKGGPAHVRWFDRLGRYKSYFTATPNEPARPFPYPISPRVVMLTADEAHGCVSGAYSIEQGQCTARYELDCARQYRLTVNSVPAADYTVQRVVGAQRPGVVCTQLIGPGKPIGNLAAGEQLMISFFSADASKFPLVTLQSIDLPPASAAPVSDTYDAARLTRLIDQSVRGQGGGPPSPNAEAIAVRQKQHVLKSVKVTAEAVP